MLKIINNNKFGKNNINFKNKREQRNQIKIVKFRNS